MIGKRKLRNNVNKGISLPIDTTIIIILAVVVLAVLLAMFFSVAGPTSGTLQAELTRTQNCNAYLRSDDNCDLKEYDNYVKDSNNEKLVKELGTACNALKISGCTKDTASKDCVRSCCIGCRGTTTSKT